MPQLSAQAPAILGLEPGTGLIGWLRTLYGLKVSSSLEDLRSALDALGPSWKPAEYLPFELRRALPIPRDKRVTPKAMSGILATLDEEDAARQIAAGKLKGIYLSDPQETKTFSIEYRGNWSPRTMLKVLNKLPNLAWFSWCLPSPTGLDGGFTTNDPKVLAALVDHLQRNPFCLLDMPAGLVLWGLYKLGGENRKALDSALTANIEFPLEIGENPTKPVNLKLILPRDAIFLPLIASACLANALEALRGKGVSEAFQSVRAEVNQYGLGLDEFKEVARTKETPSNIRAAATILGALHPEGGWPQFEAATIEFLTWARQGLPVAAAVALSVETLGLWQSPAARRLVSQLIAVNRQVCHEWNGRGDNVRALDAVLRAWRERSNAPMTSANATDKMLGLTSLS